MSAWTANNNLVVQSADKSSGIYAARGNTTNGNTVAYKTLATSCNALYFRARVKLASQTSSNVNLLKFRTNGSGSGTAIGGVYIGTTGNVNLRNDAASVSTTSSTPLGTGWHDVEVFANVSVHEFRVWLDGVEITALHTTSNTLGANPIGNVMLGDNNTGRTYDVYFDDAIVSTTHVGANTPTPTNANTATPTATNPSTATATLTGMPTSTLTPTRTSTPTPTMSATSVTQTLTVGAAADARVEEANPTINFGNDTLIRVDGGTGVHVETYLRFSIPAFTGSVQSAKIRLFASSGTADGPPIFATSNSWSETAITWGNRTAKTSGPFDDKTTIPAGAYVEYDVTPLVTTWGVYSYVLAGESTDGVDFSSRQSATNQPQLVLLINPSGPSAPTPTVTPIPTATNTPTPTPTGVPGSAIIVAVGDIACGDMSTGASCKQVQTSDVALAQNPVAALQLGDDQYECGELNDFNQYYEPSWGRLKAISKPAIGNHEYSTGTNCPNAPDGAPGYWAYYGSIGNPLDPNCTSMCQGYYSYDVGAWHIIALNSNCSKAGGCSAGSPQEVWLKNDLAAHQNSCVLAYWHHPLFSSGGIGNITWTQAWWQDLYNAGADVVLNGHDHNYERFAPQNPSGGLDNTFGIREFVVGTGGRNTASLGSTKPNSQVRDRSSFGVLKMTLKSNGYDWQFIPIPGNSFTDAGSGTCHGKLGTGFAGPAIAGRPDADLPKSA